MAENKVTFFALRHAESTAILLKQIQSAPEQCIDNFGITDLGKEQSRTASLNFYNLIKDQLIMRQPTQIEIISSDFLRARETQILFFKSLQNLLQSNKKNDTDFIPSVSTRIDERLRERNFGNLNGQSITKYNDVWAHDIQDSSTSIEGAESCKQVSLRLMAFLNDCLKSKNSSIGKKKETGRNEERIVVCVSHGDTLQILQTCFIKMNPGIHRSLPHLKTAEIRLLGEWNE
ncbi:MAG: putative histidine phosphatase family protein [Streblomastix strix]|uniref:Putative histidine phosphatase family protein n=1 Tax=Streblomastix strix TaxID=222440 RepID=A0A5J4W7B2_9EUKA|nr:MAG: putative histidine phosphatase family protein [Streblomastix strix]